MLRRRIATILHRLYIRTECVDWSVIALHEVFDKSWRLALCNIEHVVKHENLPVNIRTCANTDHRHAECVRNGFTKLVRNALE